MTERADTRGGYDVVIVGGGVMGLATAVQLRESGVERVCVVDRYQPGGGVSLLGGGGIRSQFAQPVNVALTLRMLQIMAEWRDRDDVRSDFQANGYLYLSTEPAHDELRASIAEVVRGGGGSIERLTGADLESVVPGMRMDGVRGGWYTAHDGTASPAAVLQSLLDLCERHGVDIVEGRDVAVDVRHERARGVTAAEGGIAADAVVVAAGMGSIPALSPAGWVPPIRNQRGQIFLTAPQHGLPVRLPLVFDMGTRGYFVSSRRGLIIGGADREDAVFFDASEPERTVGLLTHRLPGLRADQVFVSEWGHRAASPDDIGIVGAVPGTDGLYVATGLGHHGFMHALPAAEILVARMLGRHQMLDDTALAPARFG
ncbi:MAG: FAD-binding oxidoreductase [Microbacterium sp.]|uniref:NAD(P)/FAD-dependent oxidoreductase n=1 Tax=Microbacterium sp. TaxID=51671 RepID=UPI0039E2C34F